MNKMHESNHEKWNAAAPRWKARRDATGWRRGHSLYEEGVEHIAQHLGSLEGKNAIVLGSGDNFAAFALAGMGATVTSVDISERQLEIASERAKTLALKSPSTRETFRTSRRCPTEDITSRAASESWRSGFRICGSTMQKPAGCWPPVGCFR